YGPERPEENAKTRKGENAKGNEHFVRCLGRESSTLSRLPDESPSSRFRAFAFSRSLRVFPIAVGRRGRRSGSGGEQQGGPHGVSHGCEGGFLPWRRVASAGSR